jgi:hypothetical protein
MMKKRFLLIPLILSLLSLPLFADDVSTGEIEGQIIILSGKSMSKGMVAFFSAENGPAPDAGRYLRIPASVAYLDAEGKFRTSLPVGRYYISGIKRMSDREIGPPQDGDYIFTSRDAKGIPTEYVIEKDKRLNIKIIAKTTPFSRTLADGASGIAGTIRDQKDNPVENAVVYAYTTKEMTGLPAFTSYSTGKDGKFIITMDKEGGYYLKVRDPYSGGPPLTGDPVGDFGGNDPVAITVITGKITEGMDVKLMRRLERVSDTRQGK